MTNGSGNGDDTPVTVDWVESHLRELNRDADEIWEQQPEVVNTFNPWSALKLIFLSGIVDIYTKIIPNNGFEHMYYIDLLAGSGSVVMEWDDGEDERYVGSPLLAAALAHNRFEHMYLVESNSEKADALRQRMNYAADELGYGLERDDFTVLEGDANQIVDDIIDELQDVVRETRSVHSLAFVDNEGTTVKWPAIKRLTSIYSDLVINFPGSDLRRLVGKDYSTSMTEFFGDNRWRAAGTDADELRAVYKGNLASIGRPVQEHVRVRGSRNYFYDVIYAAADTGGGNQYMEAIEYMKDQVGSLEGDSIDKVIRYMRGEAVDFSPFPGGDPEQTGFEQFT